MDGNAFQLFFKASLPLVRLKFLFKYPPKEFYSLPNGYQLTKEPEKQRNLLCTCVKNPALFAFNVGLSKNPWSSCAGGELEIVVDFKSFLKGTI